MKDINEAWDKFIEYRVQNEGPIEMKELSFGILSTVFLGVAAGDFYNSAAELIRLVFL